jgi:SAM-dependent methyltransferase
MQQTYKYTGVDNTEVLLEARNYNNFILSLIINNLSHPTDKILDVGAGLGTFAEMISARGGDIACFEPDLSQAKVLTDKGLATHTALDMMTNESYDFIYALNVLEHIENDAEALVSWAAKLKKGGKMLIYVPAFQVLWSSLDTKVGHFRRYTRRTLTQCVAAAGLTVAQRAEYADSMGFFVTLMFKLIGNNKGDINKPALVFFDRVLFPVGRFFDKVVHKLFGKNVFIIVVNQ